MKRRSFVLSGLGAAGALVVGWGVLPPRSRLGRVDTLAAADGEVGLNGWIKIGADGKVMLAMPRSEMGQGVHTALGDAGGRRTRHNAGQGAPHSLPAHDIALRQRRDASSARLPFHPSESEPGHSKPRTVKAGQLDRGSKSRSRTRREPATGGSSSVADAWEPLRLAAATARAATRRVRRRWQWKLPAAEIADRQWTVC